jgi:drug/metabolite transporter (DMT)-like permease
MQALWMIVASLLFALMGVCVKFAAAHFGTAEMLFYRGVAGMIVMWGFARWNRVSVRTEFPRLHARRSFLGFASLGTWFYAIANLPLATANALSYLSSVWIAIFIITGGYLSWKPTRKGERRPMHASLVVTVVFGFAGVLLLLRPEMPQRELLAATVGLLSGLLTALAYLQVVELANADEPGIRIVFYNSVACTGGGAVWMTFTSSAVGSWSAAIFLIPIGVLASVAQWCMTRAYSGSRGHANTLAVANLQYSGLLFSAMFGSLLFAEAISMQGWIGIAIIILSGIGATFIRIRAVPAVPSEKH